MSRSETYDLFWMSETLSDLAARQQVLKDQHLANSAYVRYGFQLFLIKEVKRGEFEEVKVSGENLAVFDKIMRLSELKNRYSARRALNLEEMVIIETILAGRYHSPQSTEDLPFRSPLPFSSVAIEQIGQAFINCTVVNPAGPVGIPISSGELLGSAVQKQAIKEKYYQQIKEFHEQAQLKTLFRRKEHSEDFKKIYVKLAILPAEKQAEIHESLRELKKTKELKFHEQIVVKEELLHLYSQPFRSTVYLSEDQLFQVAISNDLDQKNLTKSEPTPIKRILIRGAAGVGKSTWCKHYAQILIQQNQWVIVVPLRNFYRENQPLTEEKIWCRIFGWDEIELSNVKQLITELREKSTPIYYILDGYDEVSDCGEQHPLRKWLEFIFKKSYIILTTRPRLVEGFQPNRQVEIIGFLKPEITAYIESYFDDNRPKSVNSKKKMSELIEGDLLLQQLASVPIMLEILCWVIESNSLTIETRLSFTELLNKIWVGYSKSYLEKVYEEKDAIDRTDKQITQDPRISRIKKILAKFAYECFKEKKFIFDKAAIETVFSEEEVAQTENEFILNKAGYLTSLVRKASSLAEDQVYNFSHLIIHEYLAACHWVGLFTSKNSLFIEEAIESLKISKYDPTYEIMWRFVSGLLNPVNLNRFFLEIQALPLDYIGAKHFQLLIMCVGESEFYSDERTKGFDDYLHGETKRTDIVRIAPIQYILQWVRHKFRYTKISVDAFSPWVDVLRMFPRLSRYIYSNIASNMNEEDITFFAELLAHDIQLFDDITPHAWIEMIPSELFNKEIWGLKNRFSGAMRTIIDHRKTYEEKIAEKKNYRKQLAVIYANDQGTLFSRLESLDRIDNQEDEKYLTRDKDLLPNTELKLSELVNEIELKLDGSIQEVESQVLATPRLIKIMISQLGNEIKSGSNLRENKTFYNYCCNNLRGKFETLFDLFWNELDSDENQSKYSPLDKIFILSALIADLSKFYKKISQLIDASLKLEKGSIMTIIIVIGPLLINSQKILHDYWPNFLEYIEDITDSDELLDLLKYNLGFFKDQKLILSLCKSLFLKWHGEFAGLMDNIYTVQTFDVMDIDDILDRLSSRTTDYQIDVMLEKEWRKYPDDPRDFRKFILFYKTDRQWYFCGYDGDNKLLQDYIKNINRLLPLSKILNNKTYKQLMIFFRDKKNYKKMIGYIRFLLGHTLSLAKNNRLSFSHASIVDFYKYSQVSLQDEKLSQPIIFDTQKQKLALKMLHRLTHGGDEKLTAEMDRTVEGLDILVKAVQKKQPSFEGNLFLIKKFNEVICQKIKGDALILTNSEDKNKIYFVINGNCIKTAGGEPRFIEGIDRCGLPDIKSDWLEKIERRKCVIRMLFKTPSEEDQKAVNQGHEILVIKTDNYHLAFLGNNKEYTQIELHMPIFVDSRERISFFNNKDKNGDFIRKKLYQSSLHVGVAYSDEDSFFDAAAQALEASNIVIPGNKQIASYKKLRLLCQTYVKELQQRADMNDLSKLIISEHGDLEQYILKIQYTAPEMQKEFDEKRVKTPQAVRGRTCIEGRIISLTFGVKIQLTEFQEKEDQLTVVDQLIDTSDAKDSIEISTTQKMISLAKYKVDFIPLFKRLIVSKTEPDLLSQIFKNEEKLVSLLSQAQEGIIDNPVIQIHIFNIVTLCGGYIDFNDVINKIIEQAMSKNGPLHMLPKAGTVMKLFSEPPNLEGKLTRKGRKDITFIYPVLDGEDPNPSPYIIHDDKPHHLLFWKNFKRRHSDSDLVTGVEPGQLAPFPQEEEKKGLPLQPLKRSSSWPFFPSKNRDKTLPVENSVKVLKDAPVKQSLFPRHYKTFRS